MTERPLAGCRVLIPRARQQAGRLAARVRDLGGAAVEAPVSTIESGDDAALRAALRDLAAGDFPLLCLTSRNGVDAVADGLEEEGLDARALAGVACVACVGRGTEERLWDRLRVRCDVLADDGTGESLGATVPPGSGRALLPRADIAGPGLPQALADRGYEPVEVVAYRTRRASGLDAGVLDDLAAGRIDLIAFTSPSTVRHFLDLVGDRPWHGEVVTIGPVTSTSCRDHGLEVAAEAEPHDLDGLLDALVRAAGHDDGHDGHDGHADRHEAGHDGHDDRHEAGHDGHEAGREARH